MHALIEITLIFYCSTVLPYVTLPIFFAVEALSLCFTCDFLSIMQDAIAKENSD